MMIPKEKQISYILHVSSINPYELYFDDIKVDYNYTTDVLNRSTELNPYILKNGKYKIKIRFLPPLEDSPFHKPDGLMDDKDIINSEDARYNIFFTPVFKDPQSALGYNGSINYAASKLPIVLPPKGKRVPFWENEWEIEVKDFPYELKGWSDGENLSKWDQDKLRKEVFEFYEKIRTLLNDGKIKEFDELNKRRDEETQLVAYHTLEETNRDAEINFKSLSKECPGRMVPLDGAVMKIYGNGKLVRLETANGKYKGWDAIARRTPKGEYKSYGIMIYKPKGSDSFEIIRK